MGNIEKADKILDNLLNATLEESNKMIQKGYFSKDFVELCGIVVSLTYGRWRKDDK